MTASDPVHNGLLSRSSAQGPHTKEFEGRPSIFGLTFGLQSLSGRTWFLEHTGSYGIRVYKLRSDMPGNLQSLTERR